MVIFSEHYTANNADIDEMSARIEAFLKEQELERQEITRLRLTMEELLLRISERLGRQTDCKLTLGRRFGRAYVRLKYEGEPFDPTVMYRESDGESWSNQLLANLGLVPTWSFRNSVNHLTLQPRRKARSGFVDVAVAIVLAVALGLAGRALEPLWLDAADRLVLTPLFGAFLGAMATFVGLMVFFSIVCGICGIGDTSTFERMGKVVLGRFVGLTLLWSAIGCTVLATLCYSLDFGSAARGGSQTEQVLELIYGIIPTDPVSPFLNGDSKQIIFLAVLTGVVLLILGDRVERVREWAEQCNFTILTIMERICKLVPLFVFITLLRQIWSGSLASLLQMWKPLAVFLASGAAVVGIKLLITSFQLKRSVKDLARTLLPTFLLALSTSSSSAVFGKTMDACEMKLGIPHKLVLIGLPVGNILCMPTATLCFSAVLLYLAESNGTAVSVGWLVTLILLDAILCMAMPPIPGAFLTCFGIMLTQLGLPLEGLAVMAALNVFFDAACTAYTNAYLQLELAQQAKQLDTLK